MKEKELQIDNSLKLKNLLEKLFGEIDDTTIQNILDSSTPLSLNTGDYLFHSGECEDVMYIVISGRLRAIAEREEHREVIGDIGSGETVGELAFFTKEPRMASVIAIRNSLLLEFTSESFQTLLAKNPLFATSVIQLVIKRSNRNIFELHKSVPPKNIAIINLQSKNDINFLMDEMKNHFNEKSIHFQVYSAEDQKNKHIEHLFDTIEQNEGINIMICDEEHKQWTEQCLIYSDLIILATKIDADKKLYQLEKDLKLYSRNILNKKVYLLLLHQENAPMPTNTSKWLEPRKVDLHIHLRKNNASDTRRLCRIITNKAIGLVLGGGGAKGFAHIGVVQALLEKGIEIDFLGGTSAGAIYGIGMSFADFKFDQIQALNAEAVRGKLTSGDLALPMISLMRGKKFQAYLKKIFSDHTLEDIWVNSFCVSTNYSKAEVHIHDSGLIWKQLMASMAIPGIFPPVVIGKHLHVDGGVMDNLPIVPMYQYPVDTIFAVSLSSLEIKEVNYTEVPNSWELALDKFRRKKKYKVPSIASLIINSMAVNSQQKQELTKDMVSHYLSLELKGFGLLDDKKWKAIMQKGYEQTMSYLNNDYKNK